MQAEVTSPAAPGRALEVMEKTPCRFCFLSRRCFPVAGAPEARDVFYVLRMSDDPEVLVAAAQAVCQSTDGDAVDQLVSLLLKSSLPNRLDSDHDYTYRHFRLLHITEVMVAIGKLPSKLANAELERCAATGLRGRGEAVERAAVRDRRSASAVQIPPALVGRAGRPEGRRRPRRGGVQREWARTRPAL